MTHSSNSIICSIDVFIDGDINDTSLSNHPLLIVSRINSSNMNPSKAVSEEPMQSSNALPAMMAAHGSSTKAAESESVENGWSGRKDLNASYSLFVSRLTSGLKDKSAVKYLGPLSDPMFLTTDLSLRADVNRETRAEYETFKSFIPNQLCSILSDSAALADEPWYAIINGYIFDDKKDAATISDLVPAVCLIQYEDGALSNIFLSSSWAMPFRGLPSMSDTSTEKRAGILVVDSSRHSLKWLSLRPESRGEVLGEWSFTAALKQIWVPADETVEMVLVAVEALEAGVSCTRLYSSLRVDALSKALSLQPAEELLQVVWMPSSHRAHLCHVELAALLTSKRVLIVNSELEMTSCYIYDIGEVIASVQWIGFALSFMNNKGRMRYMLPGNLNSSSEWSMRCLNLARRGVPVDDAVVKELCHIPRSLGSHSLSKLVCCLPDRVMYSVVTSMDAKDHSEPSTSGVKVLTRAFVPLEPLVLGLLWFIASKYHMRVNDAAVKDDIANVLRQYLGAKHGSTDHGATPTAHCTACLVSSLYCAGLSDLAAVAAGIDISAAAIASFPRDGEHFRYKWLPATLKYEILKAVGAYERACFELLYQHPVAIEAFINPDSPSLPPRNSYIANVCSAAAKDMFRQGQTDIALRLADVAGDDLLLALMLKELDRSMDIDTLISDIKVVNQTLAASIRLKIKGDVGVGNVVAVPLSSIGHSTRRPATLACLSSSIFCDPLKSALGLTDADKRKHELARGGGLGPLTKLGVLHLDSIDIWIGVQSPETLALGTMDSAGASAIRHAVGTSVGLSGRAIPSSWTEDVGKGKEWDLCSGYWRFSDVSRAGEEDFTSTFEPPARANFIDLSKYSTPLEVFAETLTQVRVEPSSSSVDPGEDHEKVKALYDVLLAPKIGTVELCFGLRLPVLRGGPLDVGMFHADRNRAKFTLEMCVLRSEVGASTDRYILASRRLLNGMRPGEPIWTLYVDCEGRLGFEFTKEDASVCKTAQGIVNMGPTTDAPNAVWTAIALVIDSSDDDDSGAFPTHAGVALFVNGSLIVKVNMILPIVSEADLTKTALLIAPDLGGWRITELRLFTTARSAVEIENQRDNYMSLASKRKRLQFRIKGGKKLFGPLGNTQMGEPGYSSGLRSSDRVDEEVKAISPNKTTMFSKSSPLLGAKRDDESGVNPRAPFAAKAGEESIKSRTSNPSSAQSFIPSKMSSARIVPKVGLPLNKRTLSSKDKVSVSEEISLMPKEVGSLGVCGLTWGDMLDLNLVSRPHCTPDSLVMCKAGDIAVFHVSAAGAMSTAKYRFTAESAILCPRKDVKVLGLYSQKKLSVFNIETRKKLVEQPIATTLLFWKFVTTEVIVLVTPLVVYTWSINPETLSGPNCRPQRICSRVDHNESVVDISYNGKWLILTAMSEDRSHNISVINCITGMTQTIDAFACIFDPSAAPASETHVYLVLPEQAPYSATLLRLQLDDEALPDLAQSSWQCQLPNSTNQTQLRPWVVVERLIGGHLMLVGHDGRAVFVDPASGTLTHSCSLSQDEDVLSVSGAADTDFITLVTKQSEKFLLIEIQELLAKLIPS